MEPSLQHPAMAMFPQQLSQRMAPFPEFASTPNTPFGWKQATPFRQLSVSQETRATAVAASGLAFVIGFRQARRISGKARYGTQTQTLTHTKVDKFQMLRDFLGIGVLLGSFQSAWHILPVFLDIKLSADPSLPMLTDATLPVAKTAIFAGWLAGSVCLRHAMAIYSKEELVIASAAGLLVVAMATVTLPHLTAGNLMVFTMLRFVYGILMNIATVQIVLLQMRMPADFRHQSVVWKNVFYSIVSILVAFACGGPTLNIDWRLEALLWYAVPPFLGLCVAFPNWWTTLRALPSIAQKKLESSKTNIQVEDSVRLTPTMRKHEIALATCSVACGCAFFGLSYSARQLSPNVYKSSMLLNMADIMGFLAAMSADIFGRKRVQSCSFTLAAICLLICSTGVPGSPFVLSFAVIGRLCLDVSLTTVLVGMASIFPESAQKRVLPTFAIATRIGSLLAPFLGTLPSTVSCALFSALCFAAAGASLILPEEKREECQKRDSTRPSRPRGMKFQPKQPAILYLPNLLLKQQGKQTATNATSP